MPIDFGILKPLASPSGIQVINNNAKNESSKSTQQVPSQLLQGFGQGVDAGGKLQDIAIKRQNQQMLIAQYKYQLAKRQEIIQAFSDAKAKNGVPGGLEAMYNKYLEQGDTDSAFKLRTSIDDLKQRTINNDTANMAKAGNIAYTIMQTAKQRGVQPLQVAQELWAKGQIQRVDPNFPDPTKYRDNTQFEDTAIKPTIGMTITAAKQEAAKAEMDKANKVTVAQQGVDEALARVKEAAAKDPNSPEAQQAADAYNAALKDRNMAASGNNYLTSTINAMTTLNPPTASQIVNPKAAADSGSSSMDIMDKPQAPAPQAAQQAVPGQAAPMAVPDGRVAVTGPTGEVGHIPQEQLQDAIQAGYRPVAQPQAPQQASQPQGMPPIQTPVPDGQQ